MTPAEVIAFDIGCPDYAFLGCLRTCEWHLQTSLAYIPNEVMVKALGIIGKKRSCTKWSDNIPKAVSELAATATATTVAKCS